MKFRDLFEKIKTNKIIKVLVYNSNGKYEEIYTVTDNYGNYALSRDGSVFFTLKQHVDKLDVDGKPNGKSNELWIYNVDGKFGLYNDNFKMIHGPFVSFRAVVDYIEDENIENVDY